MEEIKKKVLVLCPTNSVKNYCVGKFISNLKSIDLSEADILFSDDSLDDEHKEIIEQVGFEVVKVQSTVDAIKRGENINIVQCLANTRECLRQEFIKRKQYDYAVWFDSDIIMPSFTIPHLIRHLREDQIAPKDLVSGIYWQKKDRIVTCTCKTKLQYTDLYPVAFKYMENECADLGITKYGAELSVQDIFPSRLIGGKNDSIRIVAIGTGCFATSRKLMEDDRWHFRFNPTKPNTTEDMWFCLDILDLGYEMYLDSSICCRHHMEAWKTKIKNKANQS